MKKYLIVLLNIIVIGCTNVSPIGGVPPSSTPTTPDKDPPPPPVEIYDEADLQNIRNNLQGKYVLMQDIILSGEFNPIAPDRDQEAPGYQGDPFTGVLDGNGKTIGNLEIKKADQSYIGFFGAIGSGGRVHNLRLILAPGDANDPDNNPSIVGAKVVGTLAGLSKGSIQNVDVEIGYVKANDVIAGGLVGLFESGTIKSSYTTSTVTGTGVVGGLVGYSYSLKSIIERSYATGDVTGTGAEVGGLVGGQYGGSIKTSYATGDVTGAGGVGGLVGLQQYGNIETSYAMGDVTGTSAAIGGLVGLQQYGNIETSYATGSVEGDNNVGGLVGFQGKNVRIRNSHATGNVEGDNNVGGLVGFQEKNVRIRNSHATGNVEGDDNVGGLVGRQSGGIETSHATGDVDGKGIRNVGGLVGYSIGSIKTSYATGKVKGENSNNVGGLIGFSISSVKASHAIGNVEGDDNVGGLIGFSISLIKTSYATGNVKGMGNRIGGLVGWGVSESNRIISSYATGAVEGSDEVGGLAGLWNGSIETSYATGNITGTSAAVGGFVGLQESGSITASYFDAFLTGRSNGVGSTGSSVLSVLRAYYTNDDTSDRKVYTGASGRGERIQGNSHFLDWDFHKTWRMQTGEWPTLRR